MVVKKHGRFRGIFGLKRKRELRMRQTVRQWKVRQEQKEQQRADGMHQTSAITYPGNDVDACLCRCQSHVPSLGLCLDLSFLRHSFIHSFSCLISSRFLITILQIRCDVCDAMCPKVLFPSTRHCFTSPSTNTSSAEGLDQLPKKRRQVTDGRARLDPIEDGVCGP